MKVLIVCSYKEHIKNGISPFIYEQGESLARIDVEIEYFLIRGKGIAGYLANIGRFNQVLKTFCPDIIHAHYGLSCLFANLQRKIPVVSTYHGSDINDPKVYRFSRVAINLSKKNVFVSEKTMQLTSKSRTSPPSPLLEERGEREGRYKNVLIPCGVDTALFVPMDMQDCRVRMKLDLQKKYVLFSGAFDNPVKNPELAKASVDLLDDVELIELKGYSRQEVVWLMNAVDVVLMTSHTEGSPQFIKEAMACNCPVVSVLVGDVPEVIAHVNGCYLCEYNKEIIASKIWCAVVENKRTTGRDIILERNLDIMQVAKNVLKLYKEVLSEKKYKH